MSEVFIGEIRFWSAVSVVPDGWSLCDGKVLRITDYQTLYALIGTTYGGDGNSTFGLPDLRGRVPIAPGPGVTLGQLGGSESVVVSKDQLPAHNHTLQATTSPGTTTSPAAGSLAASNSFGQDNLNTYAQAGANTTLAAASIGETGASAAHPNVQPYLAINFIIALEGIYP